MVSVLISDGAVNALEALGAAQAVIERRQLDTQEQAELDGVSRAMWANLPADYRWLRNWEYV
mgnify:CR=1 FL=1